MRGINALEYVFLVKWFRAENGTRFHDKDDAIVDSLVEQGLLVITGKFQDDCVVEPSKHATLAMRIFEYEQAASL